MRIAVVDSGNMGGALRQRVAAAGHTVISSYSQVPAKLEPVAPGVMPDKFERIRTEVERARPKKGVRNR